MSEESEVANFAAELLALERLVHSLGARLDPAEKARASAIQSNLWMLWGGLPDDNPQPAGGQPTYSIAATVYDQYGAVLPGATVTLRDHLAVLVGTIVTSTAGYAEFDGLTNQQYSLNAAMSGRTSSAVNVLVDPTGTPVACSTRLAQTSKTFNCAVQTYGTATLTWNGAAFAGSRPISYPNCSGSGAGTGTLSLNFSGFAWKTPASNSTGMQIEADDPGFNFIMSGNPRATPLDYTNPTTVYTLASPGGNPLWCNTAATFTLTAN